MDLDQIFSRFGTLRCLVVGDSMVDLSIHTTFRCSSYEQGGPILNHHRTQNYLGGAANVAQNLRSLGATVKLLSPIGQDDVGGWLREKLKEERIDDLGRYLSQRTQWLYTTTKTRVYRDGEEPVCRIDRDAHALLAVSAVRGILEQESFDLICLSDYQKGAFSFSPQGWIQYLLEHSPRTVLCANAKPALVTNLQGIDLLSVNEAEFRQIRRSGESEAQLLHRLGIERLLHTMGAQGVALIDRSGRAVLSTGYEGKAVDVVGAGDACFAAAGLALAATVEEACPEAVAEIANAAGAAKVRQSGTNPVAVPDLQRVLRARRGPEVTLSPPPSSTGSASWNPEQFGKIWVTQQLSSVTSESAPVTQVTPEIYG